MTETLKKFDYNMLNSCCIIPYLDSWSGPCNLDSRTGKEETRKLASIFFFGSK